MRSRSMTPNDYKAPQPQNTGRAGFRRLTDLATELFCDRMKEMSTYTIVVEPDEDGGFFVVVPALPGCFTRGRTIEECRERAVEAIEVHIAGLRADGEPVPEEVGTPQLLAVTIAA
jgi:predicted RNase H-like HicB family nuclease